MYWPKLKHEPIYLYIIYTYIFFILSLPFKTSLSLYLYVRYSKKGDHETVKALPELECDMEKTQNKLDCIVCFNNRGDCIKACSIYSAVGPDHMHQLQNSIWCIWQLNLQSRYSANCRIKCCSMSTSYCFEVTETFICVMSSIWICSIMSMSK